MTAPVIVTCGEPSGIGLDLIGPAWRAVRGAIPLTLIASPDHLPSDVPIQRINTPEQAAQICPDALPVLAHDMPGPRTPGHPNPDQASGVISAIARAVDLVQSNQGSAMCTLPIHKKALQDGAGFAHPGHTEYLSALAGDAPVVMMLASPHLRVVPTTIHIALDQVKRSLTPDLLAQTITITHGALIRDFGIPAPRIAIAGLNPHAGEGGAMGHEELDLIIPTLDSLRTQGLSLIGPLSADTMFHAPARARYDAAICMYHDQALIPIKTLDFDRGVNVTLGLPFIRTSPDHGTAFDIAGTPAGNPNSLIEALRLAHSMSKARA
jgi:4-hydroxythreonine-4-phosphate dehydrogenase